MTGAFDIALDLTENTKIGEGKFREAYAIRDGLCAKVLKSTIVKSYPCGIKIKLPGRLYARAEYFVEDLNRTEMDNYRWLVENIAFEDRKYFGKIHVVIDSKRYGTVLIAERITNADGSTSRDLLHEQTIETEFWEGFDRISEIFMRYAIPHFGLGGGNLVVKKDAESVYPVLIDYKKIGARFFPLQPWIHLPFFAARKVARSMTKIRNEFKPEPISVTPALTDLSHG